MASSHRKERASRSRIIGQMLQEARDGASPTEIEVAAGISSGYLVRLEKGKRAPTVEVFISICKALKTDPGGLIRKMAAAID